MAKVNIDDKVVGDFETKRYDYMNADLRLGREKRDPAGPNPSTDAMVRCNVCGSEYTEHHVKFKKRGQNTHWHCKTKTCIGHTIGKDINYI